MISDFEFWKMCQLSYYNIGYQSKIYSKYLNQRWEIKKFVNDSKGLQAYVLKDRENKNIVVSFRGTDEFKDWVSNAFINKKAPQYRSANKLMEEVLNNYQQYRISLTGHSLGGAIAQAIFANFISEKNILESVTFNAPGIVYSSNTEKYCRSKYCQKFVTNYINKKDLINYLPGKYIGKKIYVMAKKPVNKGLKGIVDYHRLNQFSFDSVGRIKINNITAYDRRTNTKFTII